MPRKTDKSRSRKLVKKTTSSVRKIVAFVLMILSVLSSLALVIASYQHYFSPADFPLIALFGLVFPVFAISSILLFVALLIIYPKYSILSFVALLLSIPAMWRYCPINRGNDRMITNKPGFSMLTYNVYHFYDVEKELYPDIYYNRTMQNIINIDADIVALQETSSKFPLGNSRYNFTAEQIEQLDKLYPYRSYNNRLQIFSKYPVRAVSDTTFTQTAMTSLFEVDMEGRKITIINNHLQSIGFTQDDKELYVELTSEPKGIESRLGEIKVLGRKLLTAFRERASQVEAVDSIAHSLDGNIIICGDINDTPNSYAYNVLAQERQDAFLQLGSGPGFTYLANRMWVRIDYMLYEGDMEARYVKVPDKRSSDHYPVYVEFEWK